MPSGIPDKRNSNTKMLATRQSGTNGSQKYPNSKQNGYVTFFNWSGEIWIQAGSKSFRARNLIYSDLRIWIQANNIPILRTYLRAYIAWVIALIEDLLNLNFLHLYIQKNYFDYLLSDCINAFHNPQVISNLKLFFGLMLNLNPTHRFHARYGFGSRSGSMKIDLSPGPP